MAEIIATQAMDMVHADSSNPTIKYLPETFKERVLRYLFGTKNSVEFVLVAKNPEHMSTILDITGREARKPRMRLKKRQHPVRRSYMLRSV